MTRPRDDVPWPSILGAASGVAAVGLVFVGGRAMLVRQAALARRRIGKPLDENALDADRVWGGRFDGPPLKLAVFGDSIAAGLGAERRLSERMSIFGEWEFRGFGKTTLTDANGFMTEATPEHHHVKLGVNFSF